MFYFIIYFINIHSQRDSKELLKIQRLASIAIAGAMRSSPSIALDAWLNMPPLHVQVIKEAGTTAFRLRIQGAVTVKAGLKGHLKIYEKFTDLMETQAI